ncbi:uncharacterized protein [Watersipora subatra]|uniref:uncharacterized protein isoform X2 n=1 Tax=Watersipora subatra TaxID=2589382 RepID=UPI00355BB82B
MEKEEAAVHCIECSKRFCTKHIQSHDDIMTNHKKIPLDEYIMAKNSKEQDFCSMHKNLIYSLGCSVCRRLACVDCLGNLSKCNAHEMITLDELVTLLMKSDISAEAAAKETEYEDFFQKTSESRLESERSTAAIIEQIRSTKKDHIGDLEVKYDKLEEEVVNSRQQMATTEARYTEGWRELKQCRKSIDNYIKKNSKVDIVRGFDNLRKTLDKYSEGLPRLQLNNELKLKSRVGERITELEIVNTGDINIEAEDVKRFPLPKSFKPWLSLYLPVDPLSICQYKGNVYVGLTNYTVSKIDSQHHLHDSFITTSGPVESITAYNDRLYVLSCTKPRTVAVYDMSGGNIVSWQHPYHPVSSDITTIVAGKLVIADPSNKEICVYSLSGALVHRISCPHLGESHNTISASDDESVVISLYDQSKVFKFNIKTGQILWTLFGVRCPEGLVQYGYYTLLAAYNNETISVVDSSTGKVVSTMKNAALSGGHVYSLAIFGSTLLVPKRNSQQLLFCQLTSG